MSEEIVLLKIKRAFTKEESINYLIKRNLELTRKVETYEKDLIESKKVIKQLLSDAKTDYIRGENERDLQKRLNKLEKVVCKSKQDLEYYRCKFIQLKTNQ